MKFTATLMALGLAVGATATPALRRDATAVASAIAQLATDITQLNTDVLAYTGGTPTTIQADSDTIVTDTNAAISAVSALPSFSAIDATNLIGPIQALNTSINTAIENLISKKDELVAACAGEQTLGDLNEQLSSATTLANSITARVPTDLQNIAEELSAPILAAIQSGITAFTGTTPCATTSSSSAAPTTPTTSPTTSPTSPPETTPTTGTASTPNGYPTTSPGYPVTTPTYPATTPTYPATTPTYPVSTPTYPVSTPSYPVSPPPYSTASSVPSGVASSTGVAPPCTTSPGGSPPPYTTGAAPTYPVGTGGSGGSPTTSSPGGGSGGSTTVPTPSPITGAANSLSGSVGVVLAIVAILAF